MTLDARLVWALLHDGGEKIGDTGWFHCSYAEERRTRIYMRPDATEIQFRYHRPVRR